MKRNVIIVIVVLSLLGICMRSGIIGKIYCYFNSSDRISLEVSETYDIEQAAMGEIYPSFSVKNADKKQFRVYAESGKIANVTNKSLYDLTESFYASLDSRAKGEGNSVFWWEYGKENPYVISVQRSKCGIILEKKNIILTQQQDGVYLARVEDAWNFFDVSCIVCMVLFLVSLVALLMIYFVQRKKHGIVGEN